ncbi:MAG: hypothetical protein KGL39_47275 [Patescibacteria group bacterium]|nr:hypothetical protein [Patescibacteria group bacterium]
MTEQKEQEAARYRWLRETWGFTILEELFGIESGRHPLSELDECIDAAISAEKGKK